MAPKLSKDSLQAALGHRGAQATQGNALVAASKAIGDSWRLFLTPCLSSVGEERKGLLMKWLNWRPLQCAMPPCVAMLDVPYWLKKACSGSSAPPHLLNDFLKDAPPFSL